VCGNRGWVWWFPLWRSEDLAGGVFAALIAENDPLAGARLRATGVGVVTAF